MRKRFPIIVRVLLALALVVGLVAVTAAPVSAQVTAVGFTASPTTAGAATQYIVGFTTSAGGALTANVSTITVQFPAGVTLPATIKKEYVSVGATVTTVDPVVNQTAKTITLITPVAVAASTAATVTFAQVAGIENPDFAAVANFYVGYVNTSADTTPVASTTYSAITTNVLFTPIQGPAGTAISVTGVGFAPSKSIDITDATAVVIGTGSTTGTGTFAVTAYAATTSTGALTATDGDGNTHTTTATFAVTPTLGLTPTAGLKLGTVRVQGSAFTATNVIGMSVGGVPVSVLSAITGMGTLDPYAAGTNGFAIAATGYTGVIVPASGIIDITVAVPATVTGGLKAIDARAVTAGNNYASLAAFLALTPAASGDFTVTATVVTLNPATGIAGVQTVVNGTGFPAYQTGGTITLTTLTGTAVGGFIAPPLFTTGSDGQMTARTITIPVGTAAGTYVVTAAIGGASDTATFTIPQPAIPDIECNPAEGAVGSTFGITGSGFTPLTWATVMFTDPSGTPTTLLGTVNTNSAGGITASGLTVPMSTPGFGQVVVADSTGALSASDTFEVIVGEAVVLVTDGLSSIAGKYERVVSWDNANKEWLVYDPAIPELQILTQLVKKGSYWIKVTEDCTLTFAIETYALYDGWNSIGWQG